jgi:hypothetical protein
VTSIGNRIVPAKSTHVLKTIYLKSQGHYISKKPEPRPFIKYPSLPKAIQRPLGYPYRVDRPLPADACPTRTYGPYTDTKDGRVVDDVHNCFIEDAGKSPLG